MKRAKTILWTLVSIIIILLIISRIIDNEKIILIPPQILFLGFIVFTVVEYNTINNKIKQYYANGNYLDAIDYLDKALSKCYSIMNVYSCAISLVMTYMLVGDTEKAKCILEKYKKIKKNRNLLYIQMIILISENKLAEARVNQEKLLSLNFKKYKVQQDTSIKIFEMIESKKFDDNLYNSTKYPLLKNICLRYKNDEVNEFETDSIEQMNIIQSQKNSSIVRFFSILINILTFLTLFASLILVATKSRSYDAITTMDRVYYDLKTLWVFWLFLPLSLGCLIFGLLLKRKKYKTNSNIIMGIIISFVLLSIGYMNFRDLKQYRTDNEYLNNLGEIIQVDFPQDITIITQDWTKDKQTSSTNIYYKYVSVVKFNDKTEVLMFENNINDNKWVDNFSKKIKDFLPQVFIVESNNYDKFLLYCYESKEYNPGTSTSKYNYVCFAYKLENNSLIIYEFTLK